MEQHIRQLLGDALPAADLNADFLFTELDSLGIATILYVLSQEYDILLDAEDVTPRNFKNLASITEMVRRKLSLEMKIRRHAQTCPDKTAVICGARTMSYAALWEAIERRADSLAAEGLAAGRPYVFRASQDEDFLVTYCAVHLLGAVAVPLEHSVPDDAFCRIREEVEAAPLAADTADVLYTTGTTGKSKGVMLSRSALLAWTDNFISDLHFSPDLLFIVSGPLNHIASLSKIQPTLAVGATLCILDGLKDINAFFKVFDLPYKKFATFMVPASLRLMMQFSYERLHALAEKIDFIETGAAPITQTDMRRLAEALPCSRLYNTYGGTEIGCVCTYDFNDGKYMEGCVGHPMKNASVEVTRDGQVIVSGSTIMSGYVADEEGTRQVLRDGKIYGADLGYVDEEGMLHLTGRSGDVINVGGFKVNPVEVENAAASWPGLKDCICIPAVHPVIGTVLKLLVVLEEGTPLDKHALAAHIKSRLESHKVPVYYGQVDSIKRTYNGKLDRKAYLTQPK